MLYFAFGSNMSSKRILSRIDSAHFYAVAKLSEHRLQFHKRSNDGSGKGDAEWTGNPTDHIYGVVFEITLSEKPELDRFEGLGYGYEEKEVNLTTGHGEQLAAIMYYATDIDPDLAPYDWYLNHVLMGAREYKLPELYIAHIMTFSTQEDFDLSRRASEFDLYL